MNTIVTVVNGSRARFFSLQPAETPAYESSPRLVEHEDLVNPENESADKTLWSDNSSGNRSSAGGGAHGYDDHREQSTVWSTSAASHNRLQQKLSSLRTNNRPNRS